MTALRLRQPPFWNLVAYVLLHRAEAFCVEPVLAALAWRWPNPQKMAAAEIGELVDVVFPCGYQESRAAAVLGVARAWGDRPAAEPVPLSELERLSWWKSLDEAAYQMIVLGELPERPPGDPRLREYWRWKKNG